MRASCYRTSRVIAVHASSTGVPVRIVLKKHAQYGERFKVVGSSKKLGVWDLSRAAEMRWGEGDVWVADTYLQSEEAIEFKVSQEV